jgi:Protein of unknown function (DUF2510)
MTAEGPPGQGWYADPLGSAGVRWWDGAQWAWAVDMRPPGRRLPWWAKTCLAIGIAVCAANLAFLTMGLLLTMLSLSDARTFDRIFDLWICATLGLAIASLAAAARGGTRVRLSALIAAIAVVAGSWTWYRTTLPPNPKPPLAELTQIPAAQLSYPGASVAKNSMAGLTARPLR